MVLHVTLENVGSISNAASRIRIVLTRAPHPRPSLTNVGFVRRMAETQELTRESWDGVLQVGDAGKPAIKSTVDIVGESLVPYLQGKC